MERHPKEILLAELYNRFAQGDMSGVIAMCDESMVYTDLIVEGFQKTLAYSSYLKAWNLFNRRGTFRFPGFLDSRENPAIGNCHGAATNGVNQENRQIAKKYGKGRNNNIEQQ